MGSDSCGAPSPSDAAPLRDNMRAVAFGCNFSLVRRSSSKGMSRLGRALSKMGHCFWCKASSKIVIATVRRGLLGGRAWEKRKWRRSATKVDDLAMSSFSHTPSSTRKVQKLGQITESSFAKRVDDSTICQLRNGYTDRSIAQDMLLFTMSETNKAHYRNHLTPAQREEAVILYETGVMNGAAIARHFGVERNVVYRHLRSVGAVKGRLVDNHVAKLNAEIDARQRARRIRDEADQNCRLDAFIRSAADLHEFMKALLRADRDGTLAQLAIPKLVR